MYFRCSTMSASSIQSKLWVEFLRYQEGWTMDIRVLRNCLEELQPNLEINMFIEHNKLGQKILCEAARRGHGDTIGCIMDFFSRDKRHKILMKCTDSTETIIHVAAHHGHARTISQVLSYVSTNQQQELLAAKNRNNQTALDLALAGNKARVAASLQNDQLMAEENPNLERNGDF